MLIFAIETSCDETATAIIRKKTGQPPSIVSSIVSSQVKIHAPWGGVVPNLAAREHLKNIPLVIKKTFQKSPSLKLDDIDLIAVTSGPGLAPALLTGVNTAKVISFFFKKPLLAINHLEGHIYANLINVASAYDNQTFFKFPALVLIVSGGHTLLVIVKKPFEYKTIGQTRDDAVGEAFDKVAKILGLSYPGGPIVSKLSQEVTPEDFEIFKEDLPRFSIPMLNSNDLDFSFSGIKTAVLYTTEKFKKTKKGKNKIFLKSFQKIVCHEFEKTVIASLIKKTEKAIIQLKPKSIFLAGGVAANHLLRNEFTKLAKRNKLPFGIPSSAFCQDNAAMIGVAAAFRAEEKTNLLKKTKNNWKKIFINPNWSL